MKKEIKKTGKKTNENKDINNKDIKQLEEELHKLKEENEKLKKKLKDTEEILKNTQFQYLSLKNEFDAYQKRVESQKDQFKQEAFEKTILKLLPILELFIQSYEYIPEEFKSHKWTEGLDIINKKISQFLEEHWIEVIPTIGEDPNDLYHEIIHIQPIQEDEKKWKIIQEVKKGYLIKTKDGKKVLIPAKVIIWN